MRVRCPLRFGELDSLADGRFRIICRLIRVHDQVQIWTECYERESKDLLGLQTELGRTIAQQAYPVLQRGACQKE